MSQCEALGAIIEPRPLQRRGLGDIRTGTINICEPATASSITVRFCFRFSATTVASSSPIPQPLDLDPRGGGVFSRSYSAGGRLLMLVPSQWQVVRQMSAGWALLCQNLRPPVLAASYGAADGSFFEDSASWTGYGRRSGAIGMTTYDRGAGCPRQCNPLDLGNVFFLFSIRLPGWSLSSQAARGGDTFDKPISHGRGSQRTRPTARLRRAQSGW